VGDTAANAAKDKHWQTLANTGHLTLRRANWGRPKSWPSRADNLCLDVVGGLVVAPASVRKGAQIAGGARH